MQDEQSNRASTSSLTDKLSQLQAYGVKSADFNAEGGLTHVEFFGPLAPLSDDTEPPDEVARVRDDALARLATRGQRTETDE